MREPNNFDEALKEATGPNSRKVIEYSRAMYEGVKAAKLPDFTPAGWDELGKLIDTGNFVRIGNFREKVVWDQYVGLLTQWGQSTEWDITINRVTEGDGWAIQEAYEFARYPDRDEGYDSVAVYDFGEDGRLVKLAIYLSKEEHLSSAQSHQWDWDKVGADKA
ncbi:hypothetical protein [Novosphingobium album (ex Liu et al. 2023)]|uniref:SnoaL-like domain-containing protein n=1 Tax=Novosphingobium album (ex Liu et al. 2023) TaxID=3031130 RepID=A0ABT5WTC8_9SPHN|nr:hypothetical protein [Novosphingobium album (ex Liu et al. 2023)]MDE8652977.1 hypothetical protein [Novosphingobium album (ex Liu et al. 2023)]